MVTRGVHGSGITRDDVPFETARPDSRRLVKLMSDDPLMARALSRLLRKAGYDVVADEGDDAVDLASSRCLALVIVDVPDDRTACITSARYRWAGHLGAPSVLWIGDPNDADGRRADHLAKPFTGSQLLSKVAALVGN